MAFSYSAAATDKDRLRLFLGDTMENSGPRPQGEDTVDATNFSDEELEDVIEFEGNLYRAMAHCLEILAAQWTPFVTFQGDGISISRSHINRNFSSEAATLRKKHGWGATGGGAESWPVIRVDGYNEDLVDSHEVDN